MVFSVVCDILRLVFLNILVMNLIWFPTNVNLAHLAVGFVIVVVSSLVVPFYVIDERDFFIVLHLKFWYNIGYLLIFVSQCNIHLFYLCHL